MKTAAVLIAGCLMVSAQDLRVTAQALSPTTSRAIFGPLDKRYGAAQVQVCNQTEGGLSIAHARIVQQVRLSNGYTILSKPVAMVAVAEAQGKGKVPTLLRWMSAGTGTVATLTTLQVIKPNSTIGSWIILGTSVLAIAPSQAGAAAPTHAYLTLESQSLPDPIALAGLGCASGVAIVESGDKTKGIDFVMALPKTAK